MLNGNSITLDVAVYFGANDVGRNVLPSHTTCRQRKRKRQAFAIELPKDFGLWQRASAINLESIYKYICKCCIIICVCVRKFGCVHFASAEVANMGNVQFGAE